MNILVTITLIEMMVAVDLGVTFGDLSGVASNRPLVGRAALANYVCVPVVTVELLLLFDPHSMVAEGFLVLAVCPGAPLTRRRSRPSRRGMWPCRSGEWWSRPGRRRSLRGYS
jgi:predicted Na+-dependent transporter